MDSRGSAGWKAGDRIEQLAQDGPRLCRPRIGSDRSPPFRRRRVLGVGRGDRRPGACTSRVLVRVGQGGVGRGKACRPGGQGGIPPAFGRSDGTRIAETALDAWAADESLARRCEAGDEAAWRELVDRHGRLVYSLCLAAGLRTPEAEDVYQEVMLSALRGLRSYGGCHLSTWFYRIARRRIADHFRAPTRRDVALGLPGDITFPEMPSSNGHDPEADAIRAREHSRVRNEINGLCEPSRSVFLAYYVGEVPVRDIALLMGMPENTVKSHLRRGRAALRARLREEP